MTGFFSFSEENSDGRGEKISKEHMANESRKMKVSILRSVDDGGAECERREDLKLKNEIKV